MCAIKYFGEFRQIQQRKYYSITYFAAYLSKWCTEAYINQFDKIYCSQGLTDNVRTLFGLHTL